jgi:hypothetical protein
MADELQTIQNFVFSRLANDATLANLIGGAVNPRIFVGVAKQTTLFPFILIEYVSPATAFSDAGESPRALTPATWGLFLLSHRGLTCCFT